jgi:hypothetical protein
MSHFLDQAAERSPSTLSRRDFLRRGAVGAGVAGFSASGLAAMQAQKGDVKSLILLFLVGGPSHLDTWDLKPGAPSEFRGPFRPTRTSVPGLHICEHLPLTARQAHRLAIVRSLHHGEPAIHETGQQLMQSGSLATASREFPAYGAVLSRLMRERSERAPPYVVLPGPIHDTGVQVAHGEGPGFLGSRCAAVAPQAREIDRELAAESLGTRTRYGAHSFGKWCLMARRLVERGTRCVTVNMFDTVFDSVTWDCHADGGSLNSGLDDYANTLCPQFDRAFSALIADLADRGILDTTLVVATGEFGRTPRINPRGGRDHWPGVWSIVMAGGPVQGGQVIGSSDRIGAEPADRPVTPAEVAATIYQALGIPKNTRLSAPDGRKLQLTFADPIRELVGTS